MTSFGRTLLVEIRRGWARRLVRIMALLFVLSFVLAGLLNFLTEANTDYAEDGFAVLVDDDPDPTPNHVDLVELWPESGREPILALGAVPLVMAGLVIGASLVGAEWKAGTMTTVLTWEPRRARLAIAKFLGAGIVAFGFSLVLQLVLVACLLPNIAAHGSFEGADAAWFASFAEALSRGALLAGIVALAAAALAMIGRNTTVAVAAGFVIVSILEPILRVWRPWADRWLLTTNAGRIYLDDGAALSDGSMMSQGRATMVTILYVVALALVAVALFARRDVAASS